MKTKILSIVIFIMSLNTFGQNLIGTKWFKINEERKDGSVIHDWLNTKNSFLEYYFKSINKVGINTNKIDATYKIIKSELTIGNQKYIIEKLNDEELVICEKKGANIPDDSKNRLYFIKSDKIIDYCIENKWLTFINDSTISAIKYLKPKLKNNKDISTVISKSFRHKIFSTLKEKTDKSGLAYQSGFLKGNFHINTLGKIDDVQITQNSKITKGIEKDLIKVLKKLDFKPFETSRKYNQLVGFIAFFVKIKGATGVSVNIETNVGEDYSLKRVYRFVPFEKQKVSKQFYIDGSNLLIQKNYIEALKKFNSAIEIDYLLFDAYYNRAYTNLIINNLNESCKDWKYLKEMGQKEGSRLYDLKCK